MFVDNNDKSITVNGYTFGNGHPIICVPIFGSSGAEILASATAARHEIDRLDEKYADTPEYRVAVIEWRADYYTNVAEPENVFNILRQLRGLFRDRVVLFTFRSEEQGGELRHDRVQMRMSDIMQNVISSRLVDMVDVEATAGNYNIARATTKAHESGIAVVTSYHDFHKTPHDTEIEEKLRQMEVLGGDILKIAVMPRNDFDVRRIMELNQRVIIERRKPVALISMGEMGRESRIRCQETGSCLTFASIGRGSAPGQISADELISAMRAASPVN